MLSKLSEWNRSYWSALARFGGLGDTQLVPSIVPKQKGDSSLPWILRNGINLILWVLRMIKFLLIPDIVLRYTIFLVGLQIFNEFGETWFRRIYMLIISLFSRRIRKVRRLRRKMRRVDSYTKWRVLQNELDTQVEAMSKTKEDKSGIARLNSKAQTYSDLVQKSEALNDTSELQFHLRAELNRKHWGACGLTEHKKDANFKAALENYMHVVCKAMSLIATCNLENARSIEEELIHEQSKLAFFNETRHSFGRSALLLSGGARKGLSHIGVIKALIEQRMLPRVISGSSAGSIVAAILGSKTDDELAEFLFTPENLNLHFFGRSDEDLDETKRQRSSTLNKLLVMLPPPIPQFIVFVKDMLPKFFDERTVLDGSVLATAIRDSAGDLTFQEAFDRTGRIINITVTPHTGDRDFPILLNYLTTPHVIVYSAATASCAIPGVFQPHELLAKNAKGEITSYFPEGVSWSDGSVENDLPMQRLAELFNVNHTIVSQVNIHARVLAPMTRDRTLVGVVPSAFFDFLKRFVQFLRDQLRSYIKHLAHFGLTSSVFKPFGLALLPLLIQKYHGDITIVPEFSVTDIFTLLANPTNEEYMDSLREGEQAAWPHIREIRLHCMIEFMLDDCVRIVRKRLALLENTRGRAKFSISSIDENEAVENDDEFLDKPTKLSRIMAPSSSVLALSDLDVGSPGVQSLIGARRNTSARKNTTASELGEMLESRTISILNLDKLSPNDEIFEDVTQIVSPLTSRRKDSGVLNVLHKSSQGAGNLTSSPIRRANSKPKINGH